MTWDNLVNIGPGNALAPIWLGGKSLPEPMLTYCQLDFREHISMKYCLKIRSFFIHENIFENVVCKMAAILALFSSLPWNLDISRPRSRMYLDHVVSRVGSMTQS